MWHYTSLRGFTAALRRECKANRTFAAAASPVQQNKIALIIPALNEAAAIGGVLESLPQNLFSQIIVVDNGSTDATAEIAAAHGATVVREARRGYGQACLAGITHLSADCGVVVFMDADGSDCPEDALRLVNPIINEPIIKDEADLVIGARRGSGVREGALLPHQRAGNALATFLIRLLYHFRYTDLGPFRAIRTSSLRQLDMRETTYGWTVEMQVKALQRGLRVREIAVGYRPRIGQSKISGNLGASLRAGMKIISTIIYLKKASPARPS